MIPIDADGGQLCLFGGEYASPSGLQYIHFKDLWVYRLVSKTWEKITTIGGPTARAGHRIVLTGGNKLLLFGGFYDDTTSYKYFNDVHAFDLTTRSWLTIDVSGIPPSPRSGCCMVLNQNNGQVVVWGGFCKTKLRKGVDRAVTYSDMFTLTPVAGDETKYQWMEVQPHGSKPLARSGMSVAVAGDGKAYTFGGVLDLAEDEDDLTGQFGNDLHVLDVQTLTWRKVELTKSGKKKAGTNSDTGMEVDASVPEVKAPNPYAAIFLKAELRKAEMTNHGFPAPRMNTGLVINQGVLYIYGGAYEEGSRQFTLSDFYSLDLSKLDAFKTIVANDKTQEWLGSDSDNSDDDDDDEDDSEDDDDDDDDSSDMDV